MKLQINEMVIYVVCMFAYESADMILNYSDFIVKVGQRCLEIFLTSRLLGQNNYDFHELRNQQFKC